MAQSSMNHLINNICSAQYSWWYVSC